LNEFANANTKLDWQPKDNPLTQELNIFW